MAILASEPFAKTKKTEKMQEQIFTPVSIEPCTSAI